MSQGARDQPPQAITDPAKQLDPLAQQAFQLAVDFYEADKNLTRAERETLAKSYSTISYVTLGVGWTTFFSVTSIPFYRQKLRTGSAKGTNVGIAILFGMFGMMVASPFGSSKAYAYQLDKLKETNKNCYEVAKILKPSESTKWMLYYKLTKDHPEHIMKDPRSQAAAVQRAKTIYSGRDPLGLYSGPRAEIAKGPSEEPYPGEEDKKVEDPFDEEDELRRKTDDDLSAWQKVRTENGIADSPNVGIGSSWGKIRQNSSQQNPYSNNAYKAPKQAEEVDEPSQEQLDFDKLLEQERLSTDDTENSKW